jgi:hypothetical protein
MFDIPFWWGIFIVQVARPPDFALAQDMVQVVLGLIY